MVKIHLFHFGMTNDISFLEKEKNVDMVSSTLDALLGKTSQELIQ